MKMYFFLNLLLIRLYEKSPKNRFLKLLRKLPKAGSFWVSLWRLEFVCLTPARHDERSSLSLLLTTELQGGEWLPHMMDSLER